MNYKKILKMIAKKEKVSINDIEREMETALALAGVDCSVQEFIQKTSDSISERLYIV